MAQLINNGHKASTRQQVLFSVEAKHPTRSTFLVVEIATISSNFRGVHRKELKVEDVSLLILLQVTTLLLLHHRTKLENIFALSLKHTFINKFVLYFKGCCLCVKTAPQLHCPRQLCFFLLLWFGIQFYPCFLSTFQLPKFHRETRDL